MRAFSPHGICLLISPVGASVPTAQHICPVPLLLLLFPLKPLVGWRKAVHEYRRSYPDLSTFGSAAAAAFTCRWTDVWNYVCCVLSYQLQSYTQGWTSKAWFMLKHQITGMPTLLTHCWWGGALHRLRCTSPVMEETWTVTGPFESHDFSAQSNMSPEKYNGLKCDVLVEKWAGTLVGYCGNRTFRHSVR